VPARGAHLRHRLSHPNIVRLVGMVAAPRSYGLVMEYWSGGDLSSALSKVTLPLPLTPTTNPNPKPNPNLNPTLTVTTGQGHPTGLRSWLRGHMAHFHLRGVLHRELKVPHPLMRATPTPTPNPTPNPTPTPNPNPYPYPEP